MDRIDRKSHGSFLDTERPLPEFRNRERAMLREHLRFI
jgi:hypothetical protein